MRRKPKPCTSLGYSYTSQPAGKRGKFSSHIKRGEALLKIQQSICLDSMMYVNNITLRCPIHVTIYCIL